MQKTILICTWILWAFAACYKKDRQPLEHATIDKVCTEAFGAFYDERKYSRFHRVDFVGYIAAPKSAMVSNTMFVDVYEKPGRQGEHVLASFTVGKRKNQVERLKDNFKPSDLKIESDTGVMLGDGSKVLIDADVSPGAVPGQPIKKPCYVRVDTIVPAN